ncbi:class I SAM-dependent methyltransferase [Thermodesulfovibrionales bacterium]|nr:class I SAM-dependent methyltransferase [Thermodesulfovibrionales bacterium]
MVNKKEERWQLAQLKEDSFWRRDNVLDSQMERVLSRYASVISEISQSLTPDSKILDIGCGPTCVGQLFVGGSKTYLDPLMDSYLKTHSERLPDGKKICSTAESIPEQDESFDVVLCVNALDHMIDPAAALQEIRRVMKKDGMFILGIFLHPAPIAIARRFIEKRMPFFREDAHPHSYELNHMRKLLSEFFSIHREIKVFRKNTALVPSLHREDWMFICKKQDSEA